MPDSEDFGLQETSERVVEGRDHGAVWQMHMATYQWAAEQCVGLDVLDFGCGSGYGAALVAAAGARSVLAADVDDTAVGYAEKRYSGEGLTFDLIAPNGRVPCDDSSFDAVMSFQVIEHVDPGPYMAEVLRVLRPDGILFVATPNRAVRLFRFQKPWNPWHVTEYDGRSLTTLLSMSFHSVELFGIVGELDSELRRYRRNRILALPLTVPVVPAPIRRAGLSLLSKARRRKSGAAATLEAHIDVGTFDEASVLVLAVARPRDGA